MSLKRKIALVHDWLVSMRGGEKVLEVFCELFPDATIYTLVHQQGKLSPTIEAMKIKTSFIQQLPFGKTRYQYYLPFLPSAIEKLDLSAFDVVISSSHAVAKGVKPRKDALHICYCHTPMRYIWDQYEQYFGGERKHYPASLMMNMVVQSLRRWDVESAKRVHHFIANSEHVRERIQRIYQRDSTVIYPPVDVQRFQLSKEQGEYYLIVSALVPYKRVDLAVEAFSQSGQKLIVVGTGIEYKRLKSMASSNIQFTGWVDDKTIAQYYQRCKALIFPGEEDFGIVPVEAMACGKPVIAYAAGGALETVVDGKTGVFFGKVVDDDPSYSATSKESHHWKKILKAMSLTDTVNSFEKMQFDAEEIRAHAMKFDREICKSRIRQFLSGKM